MAKAFDAEFQSESLNSDIFLNKILKKDCYITNDPKTVKIFKHFKNSFIFLKTKKKIKKKINKLKFIGTSVTFKKRIQFIERHIRKKNINYKSNLNSEQKKKVINIAFRNFKNSRFHLDKRIPTSKSNIIKKKTLENFFLGLRSDKILVQFYKNNISGFCLLKYADKTKVIIDLICIDSKFTRMGLARDLILFSLNKLKKMKKKILIVSTQKENLASMKLYNKLKFIPKEKSLLYHYIS